MGCGMAARASPVYHIHDPVRTRPYLILTFRDNDLPSIGMHGTHRIQTEAPGGYNVQTLETEMSSCIGTTLDYDLGAMEARTGFTGITCTHDLDNMETMTAGITGMTYTYDLGNIGTRILGCTVMT